MPILELSILFATIGCALAGAWTIYWSKSQPDSARAVWGRCLFLLVLLALGATGLVAATTRCAGLPALGLVSGLLVVGMLWEGTPEPTRTYDEGPGTI